MVAEAEAAEDDDWRIHDAFRFISCIARSLGNARIPLCCNQIHQCVACVCSVFRHSLQD